MSKHNDNIRSDNTISFWLESLMKGGGKHFMNSFCAGRFTMLFWLIGSAESMSITSSSVHQGSIS